MTIAAAINNFMGYTTQAKEPQKDLDKDSFLKLLVAQLQNQDPTETQDTNQMVQQMTSFSQLEQLQNLGGLLQGIQDQNVALFQSQATGLVGKTVRVQGAGVEFKDGTASLGLDMGSNGNVTALIKDEAGRTLGSIELGNFTRGHHDIPVSNVMGDGGNRLPDGNYFIEFVATDDNGNSVDAQSVSDLTVESVAFADKSVLIVAGGRYYSLGDVIEVRA